jgi:hypothetical protein
VQSLYKNIFVLTICKLKKEREKKKTHHCFPSTMKAPVPPCGHTPEQHRFIMKVPLSYKHQEEVKKKCDEDNVDPEELFKFHYFATKRDGSLLKGKDNIFLCYGECLDVARIHVKRFKEGTIVARIGKVTEEMMKDSRHDFPRVTEVTGAPEQVVLRLSPKSFPPKVEGGPFPIEILFNLDMVFPGDKEKTHAFTELRNSGDIGYRRGNISCYLNMEPMRLGMYKSFDDPGHELCHIVRIMEDYVCQGSNCAVLGCSNPGEIIDIYCIPKPDPDVPSEDQDVMMLVAYPVCGVACREKMKDTFWESFRSTVSLTGVEQHTITKDGCGSCGRAFPKHRCPMPCGKKYCGRECQKKDWKKHHKVCVSKMGK